MKRNFFKSALVSTLLYGRTTKTLKKCRKKKLDGNCTGMLQAIWMIGFHLKILMKFLLIFFPCEFCPPVLTNIHKHLSESRFTRICQCIPADLNWAAEWILSFFYLFPVYSLYFPGLWRPFQVYRLQLVLQSFFHIP